MRKQVLFQVFIRVRVRSFADSVGITFMIVNSRMFAGNVRMRRGSRWVSVVSCFTEKGGGPIALPFRFIPHLELVSVEARNGTNAIEHFQSSAPPTRLDDRFTRFDQFGQYLLYELHRSSHDAYADAARLFHRRSTSVCEMWFDFWIWRSQRSTSERG